MKEESAGSTHAKDVKHKGRKMGHEQILNGNLTAIRYVIMSVGTKQHCQAYQKIQMRSRTLVLGDNIAL